MADSKVGRKVKAERRAAMPPEWEAMASATGAPFGTAGGAYSSDCYRSWRGCVVLLWKRGATLKGAETLLRSKHMRWCADSFHGKYGKTTVTHLASYLDGSPDARALAGIEEMSPPNDAASVADPMTALRARIATALCKAEDEERATSNRERELHCGGQVSALKAVLAMIDEGKAVGR